MTTTTSGQFDDGAGYERMMGRWSRRVGADFLTWCGVPPGKTWLDVGCGNGAFTEEILSRTNPAAVTGLDPSPGQIAHAQSRNTRVTYQLGDASTLPYMDNRFDASVMALVIAFVPDPARAVAEMVRVTKPGGLVATYMWDLTKGGVHLAPFYRALKSLGITGPVPPSADASRLETLDALWCAVDLQNVETKIFRITVAFADFDDFWDSNTVHVGPLGEQLKLMAVEEISGLKQALRSQFPQGPIRYEAWANAVKGYA
jgi:SAM-dependent methyltransferase